MNQPQLPVAATDAAPGYPRDPETLSVALGGLRVVGLDLSLTATGVAGPTWTEVLKPGDKRRGHERLDWLMENIASYVHSAGLVVVEGPSFGSVGRGQHERGGLWWMATSRLRKADIPTAIVPPSNLKQYITGTGSASKAAVVREVTKRFPWFDGGEDEADALVLVAMGLDQAGAPAVAMPKRNRDALAKVAWPAGLRGAA